MRLIRWVCSIIFLLVCTACAQMFPALSREIRPGVYEVEAIGNSFASLTSLNKKIEKKAQKICGDGGYAAAAQPKYESRTDALYINGGKTNSHYQVVTKTIQCNLD